MLGFESVDFALSLRLARSDWLDHMGERTKLLILSSPSNPTGGTIPREDLEVIARLAIERDVWVMTDEIYGDLVYDGAHGEGYLRFSYAASLATIEEAIARLQRFLRH